MEKGRVLEGRGRDCGANRISGDFRILGNELVTDLRARVNTRGAYTSPRREA